MKDKYYAMRLSGLVITCSTLDSAKLEDPYMIIKGIKIYDENNTNKGLNFISENKLLSHVQVETIFNKCRATIWRWEKEGKIPEAITFGREKFWREKDIMKLKKKGVS